MADTQRIHEALAMVRAGDAFAAHEVLEDLWRAAASAERDLYQGLVHVAVATYQESRGNPVGRRRQLEKARRRLQAYEPAYEGLDIAVIRAWCTASLAADRCPPLPAADQENGRPLR
jgi:predicted metal-dependent hydrolase